MIECSDKAFYTLGGAPCSARDGERLIVALGSEGCLASDRVAGWGFSIFFLGADQIHDRDNPAIYSLVVEDLAARDLLAEYFHTSLPCASSHNALLQTLWREAAGDITKMNW